MRISLTDTSTSTISSKLVSLRDEGGAVALGRVLTLIVVAAAGEIETAIAATNTASREHPCRVIVVVPSDGEPGLDAEIRVGADAGASEVIVLAPRGATATQLDSLVTPLLLPDAPIVTWWPGQPPASPADDQLGAISQRRITDAVQCPDPVASFRSLAENYSPGDTDLAWARATLWRGLIAAALDNPPYAEVESVTVSGNPRHPSMILLATWLATCLGVEVKQVAEQDSPALTGVTLHRSNGETTMLRPTGSSVLRLSDPSGIVHHVALPIRTVEDSLIEDLRRLDPDEVYGQVLQAAAKELS